MRSIRLIGVALACLTATSCISQAKYDDAVNTAQMYQRSAHDNAEYIAQLQAENASLKGAMENNPIIIEGVVDAAYTADIDARLASLRNLLAGTGHSSDEVTLLEVEGGYGFSMSDSVLFSSGSAQISSDGQALLTEMAKTIGAGAYERLWIRGHSDSDKVTKPATLKLYPKGNLQLSADRALEVAAILSERGGLDMAKMAIAGLGSSLPVASNETNEGKSANRRVEIFVIEDQTAGE
jgi:chemotaxis protein MotB